MERLKEIVKNMWNSDSLIHSEDEDDLLFFESHINKRQQFRDILDFTMNVGFTGSIVMGIIHHISGAEGSGF